MKWVKVEEIRIGQSYKITYHLKIEYMEVLKWILQKLNGKKTSIAIALCAIITYVFAKGFIGEQEVILLYSLMGALGLSANIANATIK